MPHAALSLSSQANLMAALMGGDERQASLRRVLGEDSYKLYAEAQVN